MLLNILFIVLGIVLVLWGADKLTNGAVGLAQRFHVPQLIIGLTIVAMGTSMPEFCVSLVSALKGTPDLAVGNIVGSNSFNTLMIVGIAALVTPIAITHETVKRDLPFAIIASALLFMMCTDQVISRWDALVLFVLFIVFMVFTLRSAKQHKTADDEPKSEPISHWKAVFFILLGLSCLIGGSELFVSGAQYVAHSLGVSDAVIGLTIVACGTSLPELATSVVAARGGNSGIAIGNVVGSNVFNILMILGITGLITPMHIQGITNIDLTVMAVSIILLWLFSYTNLRIERWEGGVLTLSFLVYISYLVVNAA